MPRRDIIAASLGNRGALIKVADMAEPATLPITFAGRLELSVSDPQPWLPQLKHAGAIFMGRFTSSRSATIAPAESCVADFAHRTFRQPARRL